MISLGGVVKESSGDNCIPLKNRSKLKLPRGFRTPDIRCINRGIFVEMQTGRYGYHDMEM